MLQIRGVHLAQESQHAYAGELIISVITAKQEQRFDCENLTAPETSSGEDFNRSLWMSWHKSRHNEPCNCNISGTFLTEVLHIYMDVLHKSLKEQKKSLHWLNGLKYYNRREIYCQDLPLISSEHGSIHTSFCDNVDMVENSRKRVRLLFAVRMCEQPRLTAVSKQHAEHAALWLRQLQKLCGYLKKRKFDATAYVHEESGWSYKLVFSKSTWREITSFRVAVRVGDSVRVSLSSLCWKVMEMKPFRAGQKSRGLVLSPCTSSQLKFTACTHRASSSCANWNNNNKIK